MPAPPWAERVGQRLEVAHFAVLDPLIDAKRAKPVAAGVEVPGGQVRSAHGDGRQLHVAEAGAVAQHRLVLEHLDFELHAAAAAGVLERDDFAVTVAWDAAGGLAAKGVALRVVEPFAVDLKAGGRAVDRRPGVSVAQVAQFPYGEYALGGKLHRRLHDAIAQGPTPGVGIVTEVHLGGQGETRQEEERNFPH